MLKMKKKKIFVRTLMAGRNNNMTVSIQPAFVLQGCANMFLKFSWTSRNIVDLYVDYLRSLLI